MTCLGHNLMRMLEDLRSLLSFIVPVISARACVELWELNLFRFGRDQILLARSCGTMSSSLETTTSPRPPGSPR